MALDITFSTPAQVAITLATAPDLEVDLIPDHRLGQHVDFDDSTITVGFVVTRQADGTFAMEAGGGAGPFTALTDTPSTYVGQSLLTVRVNVGETALEFAAAGAGDMLAATYDPASIAEQLVGLVASQTLTNKTLTTPTIGSFANATHDHEAAAGGGTLGHNAATDNPTVAHGATGAVVGTTNSQTLTNKTLTTPTIGSFANAVHDHEDAAGGATLGHNAATDNPTVAHGATGAVVGTTNSQTLTNKTLTTPTIASFANATHDHSNAAGGGTLPNPLNMGLENPTSSENKYLGFTPVAITITAVRMVLVGSATPSVTMNIEHSTDRSDATPNELWSTDEVITNVTTGDAGAAFDDATIPANSYVWFVTSAQSGTVTEFDLYLTYTPD